MNLGEQSSPVNSAGARGNGPELDEVLQELFPFGVAASLAYFCGTGTNGSPAAAPLVHE